jgi:PIN domain nuclease of toxin-antitoxin system
MTTRGVLLDTHVWAYYQLSPHLLRPASLDAINASAARDIVFVSPISIWELAMLERDGKIAFDQGVLRWVEAALSLPGIGITPYTAAIAVEAVYLPSPMHKDPSDRIIVATARVEAFTLITCDKAVLAFAKTTGLAHLRA